MLQFLVESCGKHAKYLCSYIFRKMTDTNTAEKEIYCFSLNQGPIKVLGGPWQFVRGGALKIDDNSK
jgi:hypothetical protein